MQKKILQEIKSEKKNIYILKLEFFLYIVAVFLSMIITVADAYTSHIEGQVLPN